MTHTKADYQRCYDLIPARSTLDNDFYWSQVAEWLDQNEHIIRSALALAASDLSGRLYKHCTEYNVHEDDDYKKKGMNFKDGYTTALEDIMNHFFPEIKITAAEGK
jgi:hypothetical protein